MFCETDDLKMVYTTPLRNPDQLPTAGNPFPGLWQPQIPKSREWRITVVGDETFDAAIYTSDAAKDDWRKHQGDQSKVEFRSESFPDDEKEKCMQFLGRAGLRFGAFDFIEELELLEVDAVGFIPQIASDPFRTFFDL